MCGTSGQHSLILAGLMELGSKGMGSSVEAHDTADSIIFTQTELTPECGI